MIEGNFINDGPARGEMIGKYAWSIRKGEKQRCNAM
jgi:hypothetical protein